MVLPCWVEGVQQLESDPNAYVLMNFSMKYLTISGWFFVGRFFEVLIGARPEPLWKLLSKVGLLYALEPIFTVIFVTNMNTVWEKVMSIVKAQIFRTVLIQKVKFLLCLSSLLAWSFILKCIVYWYAFWSVNPLFFFGLFLCRRSSLTGTRFVAVFNWFFWQEVVLCVLGYSGSGFKSCSEATGAKYYPAYARI